MALGDGFEHDDDEFIWPTGKLLIRVISAALCLAAIGTLTMDCIILAESEGSYINTIYNSVIIGAVGALGLASTTRKRVHRAQLAAVLGFISVVVAYTLTYNYYNIINGAKSCAYYEPTAEITLAGSPNTCKDDILGFIELNMTNVDDYKDINCIGQESYYAEATGCAAEYITSHGTGVAARGHCSCVSNWDFDRCYHFEAGYKDCYELMNGMPDLLYITMVLCMVGCLSTPLLFGFFCVLTRRKFVGTNDRVLMQARMQQENQLEYDRANPNHARQIGGVDVPIYDTNGQLIAMPVASGPSFFATMVSAQIAPDPVPTRNNSNNNNNSNSNNTANNTTNNSNNTTTGSSNNNSNSNSNDNYGSSNSLNSDTDVAVRIAASSGINGQLSANRLSAIVVPLSAAAVATMRAATSSSSSAPGTSTNANSCVRIGPGAAAAPIGITATADCTSDGAADDGDHGNDTHTRRKKKVVKVKKKVVVRRKKVKDPQASNEAGAGAGAAVTIISNIRGQQQQHYDRIGEEYHSRDSSEGESAGSEKDSVYSRGVGGGSSGGNRSEEEGSIDLFVVRDATKTTDIY